MTVGTVLQEVVAGHLNGLQLGHGSILPFAG